MKKSIFIAFLALLVWVNSDAQSTKSLMKSIPLDGVTSTNIDLDGLVVVEEWNDSYIRIITDVEVKNFNDVVLKKLVEAGRYNIAADKLDGMLTVTSPKMKTRVTLGGKEVEEKAVFKVYIPKGLDLKIIQHSNETTAVGSL